MSQSNQFETEQLFYDFDTPKITQVSTFNVFPLSVIFPQFQAKN